jgi:hypothetical protein
LGKIVKTNVSAGCRSIWQLDSCVSFPLKMLYGCDLLEKFSSVEESRRDDVFAESVLGSQGNKEDPERFASAARSDG